jgi:putative pyruvate formate lyase activating enzyme
VWNSSGFENVEGLSLIDDVIDLYLLDIKTLDEVTSSMYCSYREYPDVIRKVIDFLLDSGRNTYVDENGSLYGLLIRHLVFPSSLESTNSVLTYFATTLKDRAYLSLMVQFINPHNRTEPYISEHEYDELLHLLEDLGIEDGFVQELEDNVDWIPDFTMDNPFPPGFAYPLASFLDKRGFNQ